MNKSRYNNTIISLCNAIDRNYWVNGIRERGYQVERMTPFYGKHYYKYSFSLKNKQEISFRGYHIDSIEQQLRIISSVINNFDNIIDICSDKIRFEERELLHTPYNTDIYEGKGFVLTTLNFPMDYFTESESNDFNEVFLSCFQEDDYYFQLASNPRIRQCYSHIYFRRNPNGQVDMLYNFGLSCQMIRHWDYCRSKEMLHYELQYDRKYLDTASGFFVIPLIPITNNEQLGDAIETICNFVNSNKVLNNNYPGERFFPDIYFKISPHKLKLSKTSNPGRQTMAESVVTITYDIGSRIKHNSFGLGTVKQVQKELGRIVVLFDNCGEKTIACRFAKIEKVYDSEENKN